MNIVIDIKEKIKGDLDPHLYLTDDPVRANHLRKNNLAVAPILDGTDRDALFHGFAYAVTDYDSKYSLDYDSYLKIWQRIHRLPWTIVKTDRCVIKELSLSDVDALLYLHSIPDIRSCLTDIYDTSSAMSEYIMNYISTIYNYFSFGTWGIYFDSYEDEELSLIGLAGFNMRPCFDCPELGYALAPKYRGLGIAKEVCKSLIDYASKELYFEEIMALAKHDNASSIHILEYLGFLYEDDFENNRKYRLKLV